MTSTQLRRQLGFHSGPDHERDRREHNPQKGELVVRKLSLIIEAKDESDNSVFLLPSFGEVGTAAALEGTEELKLIVHKGVAARFREWVGGSSA